MSEWIAVTERLPEGDTGSVLAYSSHLERDSDFPGHCMMVMNPVWLRNDVASKHPSWTHWMPVPASPKEST